MFHSFVDSFFEGKKALVKERLMESVKVIVDGLFEEMVEQVKEMMMLPLKESAGNDQLKANAAITTTSPKPTTSVPLSQPLKSKMIFATKSKPGPSTSSVPPSQPFSGFYKRMSEEDGVNISRKNSQPNKKKAVTVELQIDDLLDGDVALDESAGGGDVELASISANPINDISNASKKHQQQPTQSGKFPCTEPNCGKHFSSNADLKRHFRTHSNAKPFSCTYPGCSLEFNRRENAIRHILNVHLKKKPADADKIEGEEDNNEPPDPATYLSVKEELL